MISHTTKRALLAATAFAALSLALPAMAQDTKAKPADDHDQTSVSEVDVKAERETLLEGESSTGSRLGLTIRETPATLDVLTAERFLERGLRTSNEALNSAPGVIATDPGGSPGSVSMRGFGGAAVSLNYDGVHQPSTMISRNYDSFAFERIEVLKGPASVLYGEGALGGAVNFVPKKAQLGLRSFNGLANYGSFDAYRVAADGNMPLSDTLSARAIVSYASSDFHIPRSSRESLTANLAFTWQPSDKFSSTLGLDYFWYDNAATYWGTPLVARAVARNPSDVVTTPSNFVLDLALAKTNFQYDDARVKGDSFWLRSQTKWQLNDAWSLQNDFAYNDGDRLWFDAESYSYNAGTQRVSRSPVYIRNPMDFWNDRLMLSSDLEIGSRRNRFMVGAEHSENRHVGIRRFGASSTVDPYNFVAGTFPTIIPATASTYQDVSSEIKINAVFMEDALNVTDRWLFVIGGRYEQMKLDRPTFDYKTSTATRFSSDYTPFNFRVGMVYDLQPKTQIYAQYTQGAAPVGTLVLISETNSKFKLTSGESVEAGLKSSFWENRVDLTLAGFYIRQKDIITRDPSNPNIQIQGGVQSARGIELSAAVKVTPQLRLDANYAYVDAKYDELIEAGGVNRAGKRPGNTPENVVNLYASYRFDNLPLKVTGGLRHQTATFGNTANDIFIKGYTVLDASIGYTFERGDLTLRVRNLTDEVYVDQAGSSTAYLAAPRSFDLTLRTRF